MLQPPEQVATGLLGNLEKGERQSLCRTKYFYSFVFIKWKKRIPWLKIKLHIFPHLALYFLCRIFI